MMKDSILILDIDGTLTDSVALHQAAFLGAMQALALPRLDTDWAGYPQHTDLGILAHALRANGQPAPSPAMRSAFETDLSERFTRLLAATALQEIPGARALVAGQVDTRWGVVFATGGVRAVSGDKLDAVGIAWSPEVLVTSSEHCNRGVLVAAALARARSFYGIGKPRAVVSIGDGRWDLEAAKALGVAFLGVGRGPAAHALAAQGAAVHADLRAVPAWLEAFSV